MRTTQTENARSLDFLKIWNNVFARDLEYFVDKLHDSALLDPARMGDFNTCRVGSWINLERPQLAEYPSFKRLDEAHQRFHELAHQIAILLKEQASAQEIKSVQQQFSACANAVEAAIDQLEAELANLGIIPPRFEKNISLERQTIWSESFETGIPEIDRKHHQIAVLIDQVVLNKFITSASSETTKFIESISRLILLDIEEEDAILRGFPDDVASQEHQKAHASIVDYLTGLKNKIGGGTAVSFDEIGSHLSNWYIEHLVIHDMELEVA